jgi:PAS domain-containing protein
MRGQGRRTQHRSRNVDHGKVKLRTQAKYLPVFQTRKRAMRELGERERKLIERTPHVVKGPIVIIRAWRINYCTGAGERLVARRHGDSFGKNRSPMVKELDDSQFYHGQRERPMPHTFERVWVIGGNHDMKDRAFRSLFVAQGVKAGLEWHYVHYLMTK